MNSSAQPLSSAEEPKSWHKIVVAVLALAFFLSPYLLSSQQNKTDAMGAELVGDGLILVTQHPALRAAQHDVSGLPGTLTTTWWGDLASGQALYRPIPSLLLGVAGTAGGTYIEKQPGDRTFPYHAIALALNVLCALLVLELAWLIFKNAKVALIAGALFATLPIHGEVIFDVAGFAELTATAFSLAAWAAWIRAGDKPLSNPGQLMVALACLFLATLSKESAFALPLVFFLFDIGRAQGNGGFGAGVGHALSKLPALVACGVVLAISLALRHQVTGDLMPAYVAANQLDNPLLAEGLLSRAMNAIRLMGAGVLSIFGINTLSSNWNYSPDYSANQISVFGAFELWNLVGLVGVGGVLALAVLAYKRCKTRSALIFALFGSMLLTSNLIIGVGTIYADRLMFFPSAIALMFLAAFLARIGQPGLIAGLLLSVAGGVWTWSNGTNYWGKQTDLWTYAAEKAAPGSARAHFNNGVDASKDQVYQLALEEFQKAIEIFPGYAEAHFYLGAIYTRPQEYDLELACQHFMAACESQLENYGYADYPKESEISELSYGPRALLYRLNQLRLVEEESKDPEGHLEWLDSLIAKGYNSAYVHHRRAVTLRALGREEESLAAFQKSVDIELTGDAVQAYGKILLDSGRGEEALTLYRSIDEFANPLENVQFLLSRAEAEFVEGPEAVLAVADQLWGLRNSLAEAKQYYFTPEQEFKTLFLRARAKSILYGENPDREQLEDLRKILSNAIRFHSVSTPETFEASAILSQVLLALGEDEEARIIISAMLLQRDAPSMRYQLGSIYTRQGQYELALEQFQRIDGNLSQAAEIFTESPSYMQTFIGARATVLHLLEQLGREDEIPSTIGGWHEQAPTEFDPVALYIQGYWSISHDDMEAALGAADQLQQEFPDDALADELARDVMRLQDLKGRASSSNDAELVEELAAALRSFKDGRGALEAAKRAVDLSATAPPRDQARRLALLAACHELVGDISGAVETNQRGLGLDLSDEDKAIFEAEISRLQALLAQ